MEKKTISTQKKIESLIKLKFDFEKGSKIGPHIKLAETLYDALGSVTLEEDPATYFMINSLKEETANRIAVNHRFYDQVTEHLNVLYKQIATEATS